MTDQSTVVHEVSEYRT